MPWGKYRGVALANVPQDYLLWLAENVRERRWAWLKKAAVAELRDRILREQQASLEQRELFPASAGLDATLERTAALVEAAGLFYRDVRWSPTAAHVMVEDAFCRRLADWWYPAGTLLLKGGRSATTRDPAEVVRLACEVAGVEPPGGEG